MSDQHHTTNEAINAPTPGSEELLRETLKRCSRETLEAALKFRESNDASLVPVIVLGIIERFLDPDIVDKLREGDDNLQFMEDLGLDSLTMIEAVMMVEEALGVSIKNEELIDLRSIGDLKAFIGNKVLGVPDGRPSGSSGGFYPLEEVAATVPQQEPFLFLSEATLEERVATGKYRISGQEEFLKGHFKDDPVFPASIMLEALGQLAVFMLIKQAPVELSYTAIKSTGIYFTGADGVRCFRVCRPGDTLELEVMLKRVHAPLAVFSGSISVNGEKTVSVDELSLAFEFEKEG